MAKAGLNSRVVLFSSGLNNELLLFTKVWRIALTQQNDEKQNSQLPFPQRDDHNVRHPMNWVVLSQYLTHYCAFDIF